MKTDSHNVRRDAAAAASGSLAPGSRRGASFLPAADGEPPSCEVEVVHEDAVHRVSQRQAAPHEMQDLAALFQALANPTRLRIVEALAQEELCVCDLAAVTGSSQSAVSHQLRQLRQMGLVRYRKAGRMVYYHLADDHAATLFLVGLEHVRE